MPYQLPALPYGFDALEPHVDLKYVVLKDAATGRSHTKPVVGL